MQLFSIVFSSNVDSFSRSIKFGRLALKWLVSVNGLAGRKYGDGADHSCCLDDGHGGAHSGEHGGG